MNLLPATRRLLKTARRGRSLQFIATRSGDKVQYEWLKKFASGEIPDPGVRRVQALHDYLVTLKLATDKGKEE